jgi:hypothetical protein
MTPVPRGGHVVATRETGGHGRYAATIAADGRFAISAIRLRRSPTTRFTVTIDAPPNATRKVHLSAICLDCLAGTPPSTPR